MSRRFLAAALASALALFVAVSKIHGAAQRGFRLTLIDTAVIASPRLTESSGVAPVSTRRGAFWTHNDSGNPPEIFAVDTLGADLGSVRVAHAQNYDWEDMAAGPCFVQPGHCLYLGDIGDNDRRRGTVVVYRLLEPPLPGGGSGGTAPLLDSIVLRYPDHAHNAEALAVTADGRLLVAVKDRRGPALLFSASASAPNVTLTPLCSLAMRIEPLRGRVITGMAISPNGRTLAVRTYVSLHFFRTDEGCTPISSPSGMPLPVIEAQGEAVTFDGPDRLVLTSERGDADHALLTRLRVEGLP